MAQSVKGTGIVCEYNPFHKGHAYQIKKVRDMGAEFVVCAMSGDFTQRGEPAFQDKYVRAQNAVKNGADIVLEIPFPFSCFSAEGFARAGISVLEDSGLCDSFAFGSECADVTRLLPVARLLSASFHKEVVSLQKQNPSLSYAKARQNLVGQKLGEEYADVLANPNDILAVEYLRANRGMKPIAIERKTPRGGYDDSFVSSSYIRNNLFDKEARQIALGGMPENCSLDEIFQNDEAFYNHVLVSLMQKKPPELCGILEVPGGSEHSIVRCAKKAESYDELCSMLSSKTLTDAKIRRMLLFSFFGIGKVAAKSKPLYTTVLAYSDTGRKKLKEFSQDRKIIVSSRVGEIKKDSCALEQYNVARLAFEVLTKCRNIMYRD